MSHYEALQDLETQRRDEMLAGMTASKTITAEEVERAAEELAANQQEQEAEADDGKVTLTLKSSGNRTMTVQHVNFASSYRARILRDDRVKKSRTISYLLEKFLAHFNASEAISRSWVSFDGDKIGSDTLIEDTEVDDEDTLDVHVG